MPPPLSHLQCCASDTSSLHLHFPMHALRQPQCKRIAYAVVASLSVVRIRLWCYFDCCFPSNCLTAPVNEKMRSFFNVVVRGPPALHGCDIINGDANLDARDKIACNISQLLIYNTSKGTHHAVKTAAVRQTKERETHFPLYQGLKLHGQGRNKKQIEINHKQGISVLYKRVMDVKLGIARAVCARHVRDGAVLPTNSRLSVFTTQDVDNLDSKAQGNFSLDEFHGYALSVTNHLSHDNHGIKRTPIKLDPSISSTPKLPDSYVIQDPVELIHTDVFVPRGCNSKVRPAPNVQIAKVKAESWMAHSPNILQQNQMEESDIITWSWYNSMLATEDSVKPLLKLESTHYSKIRQLQHHQWNMQWSWRRRALNS